MTDLLLDAPYWLMVLIALIGLVLLILANQRQNKPLMYGGVSAVALAVVLLLLGLFAETGKKQVAKRTKQLVNAVVAADTPGIRAVLDAKANAYGMDAESIAQAATAASKDALVQSVTITHTDITQDASGIISEFTCITQFKPESSIPTSVVPTSWKLSWVKTPAKGWLVYDIQCTRMGTQDASTVVQYLVSHRVLGIGN